MHVSHLTALLLCLSACSNEEATTLPATAASSNLANSGEQNTLILRAARIVQSDLLLGASAHHLNRDILALQQIQNASLKNRLNAVLAGEATLAGFEEELRKIARILAQDTYPSEVNRPADVPSLQERLMISLSASALSGGVQVRLQLDAFSAAARLLEDDPLDPDNTAIWDSLATFTTAAAEMQRGRLLLLLSTLDFFSEEQKQTVIHDPAVNGWIYLNDTVEPTGSAW
jgi:hypothetical protein